MAKYEASLQNRKKRKKNKREKEKERKREEQAEEEGPAVDPLMAAMGFNFASFGSSKKK